MDIASKIVSSAIIGDSRTIIVNDKAYVVNPPTIERIAGASYYLSDLQDCANLNDLISQMKDIEKAAKALAWFISDEQTTQNKMRKEVEKVSQALIKGNLSEIIDGLAIAYSLIGIENFKRLSTLAKNVGMLTAKQRPQETHVS